MNIDLHLHSFHSGDATLKPETIVKVAKQKGLAVAITDHDTAKAWDVFARIGRELDVVVILGEEITVLKEKRIAGHLIGLFLQQEIKSRNYLEVVDEIKSQDGLLMAAHPFDIFRTSCSCLEEIRQKIDLVEVFNARGYFQRYNKRAEEYADANKIAKVAGSDAHTPEEIGNAYTIVDADSLEEARKKLKEGKTTFFGKGAGLMPHIITQLARLKLVSPR